jgi:hypothetical protein
MTGNIKVLSICLLSLSPFAAWAEGWVPDSKTGCKVWNSSPDASKTVNWSGECKDGMANGKGTAQWYLNGAKEDLYEGGMAEGKRHGQGKRVWATGNVFDGVWEKGDQKTGTKKYNDGYTYSGEWKGWDRNGKGKLTWPNGATYDGDWVMNVRSGQGVMTWLNGDKYEGGFRYNRRQGQGSLISKEEGSYNGEWFQDSKTGKGKLTAADATVSEGYFANDAYLGKDKPAWYDRLAFFDGKEFFYLGNLWTVWNCQLISPVHGGKLGKGGAITDLRSAQHLTPALLEKARECQQTANQLQVDVGFDGIDRKQFEELFGAP